MSVIVFTPHGRELPRKVQQCYSAPQRWDYIVYWTAGEEMLAMKIVSDLVKDANEYYISEHMFPFAKFNLYVVQQEVAHAGT